MKARTAKTEGRNDQVLRAERNRAHRDVDPQGLLTRDVMRRHIEAGTCPFCPRGPFTSLSGHTSRAHGIDRFELREMAGIAVRESIASPEHAAKMRAIANERNLSAIGAEAARRRAARGETSPKVHMSVGSERLSESNKKRNAQLTPEERSERARKASLSVPKSSRARRAEKLREWHQTHPYDAQKRERFGQLMRSEEIAAKREANRIANRAGHGTDASYRRGCRCNECREARRLKRNPTNRPAGTQKKLSESAIVEVRTRRAGGESLRSLAEAFSVSEATVSNIARYRGVYLR